MEVAGVGGAFVCDIAVWRCQGWSQVRPYGVDLNARVRGDIIRESRGTGMVHVMTRTLGVDNLGDPVFRRLENGDV